MPLRTQAGATPSSITTTTVTYGGAVSAGDLLVAVVRTGTASVVTSVSDSVNGAWTLLSGVTNGAGEDFVAYFVNSGAGTPTVTFNFGGTSSPQISIAAFSNVLTSGALDQTGTGSTGASGTSLTADSVTTTHANEVVIGFFSQGATETFSQSGSWVIVSGNGTPTARSVIVYREVTSTGTYQPAVTSNSSAAWIGQSLSFQQSGGGGTGFSSSVVGSTGEHGQNVAVHGHIVGESGSSGVHGQNVALHGHTVSEVGSSGAQGQNVAQRNIDTFVVAGLGSQGQNTIAAHGAAEIGSSGFQGQNVAVHAFTAIQNATAGAHGQNVASRGVNATEVGSAGAHGQNLAQLSNHPTAMGSVGTHGQNDAAVAHAALVIGSTGATGQCSAARAISSTARGSQAVSGRNALTGQVPEVRNLVITVGAPTSRWRVRVPVG